MIARALASLLVLPLLLGAAAGIGAPVTDRGFPGWQDATASIQPAVPAAPTAGASETGVGAPLPRTPTRTERSATDPFVPARAAGAARAAVLEIERLRYTHEGASARANFPVAWCNPPPSPA